MLTTPPLNHQPRLLVRPESAGVRGDRLEMDAAQVAAYEPKSDELENRCRPHPPAAGLGHQADSEVSLTEVRFIRSLRSNDSESATFGGRDVGREIDGRALHPALPVAIAVRSGVRTPRLRGAASRATPVKTRPAPPRHP